MHIRIYLFLFFIPFVACTSSENEGAANPQVGKRFVPLTSVQSGIDFVNSIEEDEQVNVIAYDYLYNGAGVAVGDVNGDGLEDLFFTGNQQASRLYLNKGDLSFEDVTRQSGIDTKGTWCTGATFIDINDDGLLDLYICAAGPDHYKEGRVNQLWVNQGGGVFQEKAADYGLDHSGHVTAATFFDADLDGDLDCYLLTHPDAFSNQFDLKRLQQMINRGLLESDIFLRNDNGIYVDASKEAGISEFGFGLGVVVEDFNKDGYPDIYVSNDYDEGDILWENQGDGTFKNQVTRYFKHTSNYGMGCDAGDFNNDGLADLLTLDMAFPDHERSKRNMASMDEDRFNARVRLGWHYQYMVNTLQLNNGNGTFSDIAQMSGLHKTDWSWSGLFADLDNDGWQDVFISNGYKRDTKDNDLRYKVEELKKSNAQPTVEDVLGLMPSTKVSNFCFQNKGDYTFEKVQEEWGLDRKVNSNGAVYADLDNDGDLDLVINNMDEASEVIENRSDEMGNGNWIGFEFETGDIGAKVEVYANGKCYSRTYQPIRGYLGSVGQRVIIGLGDVNQIDSVRWIASNGKSRLVSDLATGQYHAFNSEGMEDLFKRADTTWFVKNTSESGLIYRHSEDETDDFEKEVLLPHKMTEWGPGIAKLDVNQDGLMDVWVGGGSGTPGGLFIQLQDGTFERKSQRWLDDQQKGEDVFGLAFDADGDGLEDLLVLSGDNGLPEGNNYLRDRLMINQADGNLRYTDAFEGNERIAGGAAIDIDFDGDGDLDLFVGGRNTPGKYPLAPQSFVYENDNGTFSDVTSIVAPEFERIGMVTAMDAGDIDGDGDEDVIVTGEWMAPTLFRNENGVFSMEDLGQGSGWYHSVELVDLENDGDLDIVIGNLGWNNKFQPSKEKPLLCYANDFDNNGQLDIVLASKKDELLPVRGRECSSEQMPFIAKKYDTYQGFAEATLEDIYGEAKLEESTKLEVTDFTSFVMRNEGGKFTRETLPPLAQSFPIRTILAEDVDGDGDQDLILAGNFFGTEVETTRYDAGNGLILLQEENGWDSKSYAETGISLPQDVRGSIMFKNAAGNSVIVSAVNKGYIIVHERVNLAK